MDANLTVPEIAEEYAVYFRALGTTYKVLSSSVDGSAAIVEHTLEPKSIGAPMHMHTHEDEISYVIEGELSVIQDGRVQTAKPGQFIAKPRGRWHTFWNSGDATVRFVEVIVPGNFESYFAEIAPFLPKGEPPDLIKLRETAMKYGLKIDPEAAAPIIEKYGLKPL